MSLAKNKLWNLLFDIVIAGYSLLLLFNFVGFTTGAMQPKECGVSPGIPAGDYFCRLENHPYWFLGALVVVGAAWLYFKKDKQEDLKDPVGLVCFLLLGAILVSVVFSLVETILTGLYDNTVVMLAAIVLCAAGVSFLIKSDRKKKQRAGKPKK